MEKPRNRKRDKLDITSKDGVLILKRKRTITVSDIQGIIGKHRVKLEDIDNAIGRQEEEEEPKM